MLQLVIGIFNFIGNFVYVVFYGSYSVGRVAFTFAYKTLYLLFSFISNVVNNLFVLLEEFENFRSEIVNNINKISLCVSEGASEMVKSVQYGRDVIKDTFFMRHPTRNQQLYELGDTALAAVKFLLHNIYGGLSFLSDILWFAVTLLPNTCIALFSLLSSLLFTVFGFIWSTFASLPPLIIECTMIMVERVRNKPIRVFVEFFVVALLVSNFVAILEMIQVFMYFIYRKTLLLNQEFYREYSRRRQSTSQQALPVSNSNRRRMETAASSSIHQTSTLNQPRSNLEKDDEGNEPLCVICQESPRCVVLFPCKHLCLCEECSHNLASYQNVCPLCRICITNQLRIYV